MAPEGYIAKIGIGSYAGSCLHDGIRYAVINGSATCPGYFSVFPLVSEDEPPLILKEENHFAVLHSIISGSPACDETVDPHDGFN